MARLLYRLGRFSARRRKTVLLSGLAILILATIAGSLFGGTVATTISIPGTPTNNVTNELAKQFPSASGGSGSIVFATKDGKAFTSAEKTAIAAALTKVAKIDGVRSTTNPFTSQASLDSSKKKVADGKTEIAAAQKQLDALKASGTAPQATIDSATSKLATETTTVNLGAKQLTMAKTIRYVSNDGSAAIGSVKFEKPLNQVQASLKTKVQNDLTETGIAGVKTYASDDLVKSTPSIVGPGEIVGIVIAAIVLMIVLGTIIGAGLPLLSAIVGVLVSLMGATAFSGIVQFNSVSTVLGIMLGLAVGIDYSLFILNRHRTQLKTGMRVQESIGFANGTSGNAVVFAGSTVVVALLALNVTGVPFLGVMGTVGAAAVAVAILMAITFTPAMLSIVGMRILRKKERAAAAEIAPSTAPASFRDEKPMSTVRAIVTVVVGVAVLGVIALPAMHMRLGLPGGESEATTSTAYLAYTTTADKFGAGENGPLVVVADLPTSLSGTALEKEEVAIGQKLFAQDHVSAVASAGASSSGRVLAFEVISTTSPNSQATADLVHDLRDLSPVSTTQGKATLGVAGNASASIDVSDKLAAALPLYLAVVVGLSLIILIIVFRSILVPLTATAGFVLSLIAAFGGLTAVYQYGRLASLFGIHDPGPILAFLPVIEVGVLFGLAMDYQLFLVSGMREAFAHGASARSAVQHGVHAGRTVVIAAAIIMISVFAGFIFSDSSVIRPIGFGLSFGILLDAFVVRLLLIPAAMHLLGRAAWWLPKWLDRIIPDVDVEGAHLSSDRTLGRNLS